MKNIIKTAAVGVMLGSVSLGYAASCYVTDWSYICAKNGALVGSGYALNCNTVVTGYYAWGNWYSSQAILVAPGQPGHPRTGPTTVYCSGTVKVYNNCTHSYDFFWWSGFPFSQYGTDDGTACP